MKKVLALILAAAMTATVFAGCNDGSTSSTADDGSSAASPASEDGSSEEPSNEDWFGTLRVLYPGTTDIEKEVANDLKAAFEEQYPNATVEYNFLSWTDLDAKLLVMDQANDYPDVTQINEVENAVRAGALEPIEPYLEKSDILSLENFNQVGLDYKTYDGVLYGLPHVLCTYAHIYNKDLCDEAGIDPTTFETWDDVLAAVETIGSMDGKYGYAMANGGEGRFSFRDLEMVALSNGFQPDDTSEETKDAYIETLQLFADMAAYMPEAQSAWQYPELFQAWNEGNIAIMHTGSFFTGNLISHGDEAMDWTHAFAFPAGPSADETQVMTTAGGYALIAGSSQKDLGFKYIEVALSEPILGKIAASMNYPAVDYVSDDTLESFAVDIYGEDVASKHISLVGEFRDANEQYGIMAPIITNQPSMEKVVQGAMVKLTNGEIDAETCYNEIKQGIDEIKAQTA